MTKDELKKIKEIAKDLMGLDESADDEDVESAIEDLQQLLDDRSDDSEDDEASDDE